MDRGGESEQGEGNLPAPKESSGIEGLSEQARLKKSREKAKTKRLFEQEVAAEIIENYDVQKYLSDDLSGASWVELDEDGTLIISLECRANVRIDKKIGKVGIYFILFGCVTLIIFPVMFLLSIITIGQMAALIGVPFVVGGGLLKVAENFNYLFG